MTENNEEIPHFNPAGSNPKVESNEKSNGNSTLKIINSTPVVIKKNKNTIDLKLFVGQIPKNWTEKDITAFFAEFGDIIDAQILRDKQGNHKGCAFVKFASMTQADKAIEKLDKKLELPGSNAAIQIKWADGEPERLGIDPETPPKLFIGSLPKNATEQNLRDIFEPFGTIEELHLMKEQDGTSKGSGFVKYVLQESALLAIRNLHAQAYILNSDRPIEVRLAENKKKERKENSNYSSNMPDNDMWHGHPMPIFPFSQPFPMMYYYQYFTKEGVPYYYNAMTSMAQYEKPPHGAMIYPGMGGMQGGAAAFDMHSAAQAPKMNLNDMSATGVKKQGPNGANLFIFHIPNTWKDSDLYNLFSPYGVVISARIMTDKKEGKSRGFGFVSYESAHSAKMAIEHLNGFQADSIQKSPKSPRKSILKPGAPSESPRMKKTVNMNPNSLNTNGNMNSRTINANPRISFKPDLIEIKEVESYKKYNTDMSENKVGCCGSSKCTIQ